MSLLSSFYCYLRTRQAARAVNAGNLAALERALYLGANPNGVAKRCERGYRGKYEYMLHVAIENQWLEGVQALLDAGANTELRGGINLATPLFLVAVRRHVPTAIMMALAKQGADPDGLGWEVDMKALNETMDLVGWDYPSQSSLISVREMTVQEIVDYRNDQEEVAALEIARERYLIKQSAKTLEDTTAAVVQMGARTRL